VNNTRNSTCRIFLYVSPALHSVVYPWRPFFWRRGGKSDSFPLPFPPILHSSRPVFFSSSCRPSVSSSLHITNRSFRYASPYLYKISFLLHSVNLILFTLLLVHLILHISPHHSHHLRSHHLSLSRPFTQDLKLISFTNPFLHIGTLIPSGLPSRILTCTGLNGH